jgi:hypothetical protein
MTTHDVSLTADGEFTPALRSLSRSIAASAVAWWKSLVMALCDRLEASLATGDQTRRRLLDALLAKALLLAERELEAAE